MKHTRLSQVLIAGVLLAGGMILGAALSTSSVALGEIRPMPQPQAFQSGGQLSVPVLKEIASTLHQIDARLARLETIAARMHVPPRNAGGD